MEWQKKLINFNKSILDLFITIICWKNACSSILKIPLIIEITNPASVQFSSCSCQLRGLVLQSTLHLEVRSMCCVRGPKSSLVIRQKAKIYAIGLKGNVSTSRCKVSLIAVYLLEDNLEPSICMSYNKKSQFWIFYNSLLHIFSSGFKSRFNLDFSMTERPNVIIFFNFFWIDLQHYSCS